MISESGEQEQTSTKGKKSSLESLTDTVKEKVMGTAKSVKEGVSSTIATNDNADDGNLESAQVHQDRIGETSSDPTTTGPRDVSYPMSSPKCFVQIFFSIADVVIQCRLRLNRG
jgi:hypothetical protein